MAPAPSVARPLVVVQARTGSERLPAKVLADLCGRPLLDRLVERLSASRTTAGVVVATTTDASDDPVQSLAEARGARVVRGHPTDVLARFISVLDVTGAASIVRISADSPFIDAAAVDAVVSDFEQGGADLVQNHRTPGWPIGTAVEVLSATCLRRIDAEADDPQIREHVTLHAYDHPERFTTRYVSAPPELAAPELQLCVDTAEDLERARRICAAFGGKDAALADIVERFREVTVA